MGIGPAPAIRKVMQPPPDTVVAWLWEVLEDPGKLPDERLRAACALAAYAEKDARWEGVGRDVALAVGLHHAARDQRVDARAQRFMQHVVGATLPNRLGNTGLRPRGVNRD